MRKNPLTMLGRLDQCYFFMYRCPVEIVRPLVPSCFDIKTYQGQAIIGIVASQLKQMRPWPFPTWTGLNYLHVGYRVYVHFSAPDGKDYEGLYFLRSDANHTLMKVTGNLLTDFRFHRADIKMLRTAEQLKLEIHHSDDRLGDARAILRLEELQGLRQNSMFKTIEEAKRVLHYEPYGLSYQVERNVVNIVKVTRDESKWKELPVVQAEAHFSYLDFIMQGRPGLEHELSICVEGLEYRWERGIEIKL